ncbi:MAG TPA: TetR/AcrR family transcriptional regulator [Mycobacteriales bacterium]|jgi:AcrR family transcriptional regulator|nr:TetR/AcrR family transcriptional regulator [Mycobacteriales bacterium]
MASRHGATARGTGRPRDPDVEARALAAAYALYARRGWAGFTFEEVAREAGAGKSSLYLRWPTKYALLRDSIRLREPFDEVLDSGNLRDDLLALAATIFRLQWSEEGVVALRLLVESRFYEDLREGLQEGTHAHQLTASRAVVRRAIERGELPEGTSVALVTDMIVGSVLTHTLATPWHLRDAVEAQSEQYLRQLVDAVLLGVGHVPLHSGRP